MSKLTMATSHVTLEQMVREDMVSYRLDPKSKLDIRKFWKMMGVCYEKETDQKQSEGDGSKD